MAQGTQTTTDVDPITESFIVDRQRFWQRFTGFTLYAATVIAVVLLLLWWLVV